MKVGITGNVDNAALTMARYEHLPIYKKALDLTIYFEEIVRHFSRYHKYTLGTELREKSREIVGLIIKANSTVERLALLLELCERIEGLKVSIVGDIAHSRVARSNIWGLTKLGAEVTVCAPPMLIPPEIEKMGVLASNDIDAALKDADAVNVLRMQFERDNESAFPKQLEYFNNFGITEERLEKAKRDIVVMHPGPINRGIEISSGVADGVNSVILEQVTNGIAVRMAVLFLVAQAVENRE